MTNHFTYDDMIAYGRLCWRRSRETWPSEVEPMPAISSRHEALAGMSRSGYTDDLDPLAHGRWRQAVRRALNGKRGQALLRELLIALDEMQDKRLYAGGFATSDGEYCALGVLGARRGTKMDDLGDEDDCDAAEVGKRFGIARAMAAEIMWENDEYVDEYVWADVEIVGPVRPQYPDWGSHKKSVRVHNTSAAEQRYRHMREWVASQIKPDGAAP